MSTVGSGGLTTLPDRRDGAAYVTHPDVAFAVDVALATGRPLLLRGEPGSGKSSLAAHVARARNWRYYEHVVTSRTSARDLLWSFDAVRRLADAQVRQPGEALNDLDYIRPGVLWWAFAPESAQRRGSGDPATSLTPATDPNPGNASRDGEHAVVLIDEIDKAEPDMPNGLLVPLGSNEFQVTESGQLIRRAEEVARQLLVVITTNEERELPQAFLRRCVVEWLPEPTHGHLVAVAREHLRLEAGGFDDARRELADHLARELLDARAQAQRAGLRAPSTAEYLDALRALLQLGITVRSPQWQSLRRLTLLKDQPRSSS